MENNLVLDKTFGSINSLFKIVDDLWWDRTNAFTKQWKNFLPYNLYENKSTGEVTFSMSVAGYTPSDLEVTFSSDGLLKISNVHTSPTEKKEELNYLHKGLATRAFQFALALNPLYTVKEANMQNGILTIVFQRDTVSSTKIEVKST